MATMTLFQDFKEQLGLGLHDLNNDTLKIYLTNTAPVVTNTVFGTPAEIAAGNGYTAGGTAVGTTAYTETSGTGSLTGNDVVFTASGGAIAQFRYAVLYNDTNASDALIGWWDKGSAVDLADTNTFTVEFGATILTIT